MVILKFRIPLKTYSKLGGSVLCRYYSSALYITNDKATATCAILTPYIDFGHYFKNVGKVTENLEQRKSTLVDMPELYKLWNLYQDLDKTRKKLENYRTSIADEIKSLKKKTDCCEDELTKLMNRGKIVRDDLKLLKEHLQPIQENVIIKILSLPNELHELTPRTNAKIDYVHLTKSEKRPNSHIEVGENLKLLNYMNPNTYYLFGKAALMEQGLLNFFSDRLEHSGYIPFCNPDFSRSVVVEGCGIDYDNFDKIFTILEPDTQKDSISRLHLTGGASLFAFMAYHTKLALYPSVFPLQYYSSGRQYMPSNNTNNGLFDASQSSCIHIYSATLNSDEKALEQFSKMVSICNEAYKELGYHFRILYRPSYELQKCESLRLSFEMYSSHLDKYIEVGYISMYDSYLSKRLLFTYREGKGYIFPKVISGTIVNFAKIFGCVLENTTNELVVPEVCKIF